MPTDFLSYVVSPFLLRGALLAFEIRCWRWRSAWCWVSGWR